MVRKTFIFFLIGIFFSCNTTPQNNDFSIKKKKEKYVIQNKLLANEMVLSHIGLLNSNDTIYNWEISYNGYSKIIDFSHNNSSYKLKQLCQNINYSLFITGSASSRYTHLIEKFNDSLIYSKYYTGVSPNSELFGAGFKLMHTDSILYLDNLIDKRIYEFNINEKNSMKKINFIYLLKDSVQIGFQDESYLSYPINKLIEKDSFSLVCRALN